MLGDFINKLFNKDQIKWDTLSEKDKDGFFIILNRIMAIKYPLISNDLNTFYINKCRAVDWWHEIMSRQYFKAPGWVWTKTKFDVDNKSKDKKIDDYPEEIILNFLKLNKISKKELKDAYKLFKNEVIKELERFGEFQKGVSKIT